MDHTHIYIKNTNPDTGEESWRRVGVQDIAGDLEIIIDWHGCIGDKFTISDGIIHGMPLREPGVERKIPITHTFVKTQKFVKKDGLEAGIYIDGKLIFKEVE